MWVVLCVCDGFIVSVPPTEEGFSKAKVKRQVKGGVVVIVKMSQNGFPQVSRSRVQRKY